MELINHPLQRGDIYESHKHFGFRSRSQDKEIAGLKKRLEEKEKKREREIEGIIAHYFKAR